MTTTQLNDLVKRGLELHREGQVESAARMYSEILQIDPRRADALHLFGVALYHLGDPASAIKAISRAIAMHPNLAHFHINLGEIYRFLGETRRAAGCLYLAMQLDGERVKNPANFDLLIFREGQFDDVPLPVRKPPEVAPSVSVDHTEAAIRLRAQGDLNGSFEHFVEAVRLAPEAGMPHSNLGQALLEMRRLDEALEHGSAAVRLAPDYPEPWNHLGNILRAMGRSIEARACYLEALRLAPNMAVTLRNLGRDLLAAFCPDEALVWLRMALENDPTSVSIRSNFAAALKEQGKFDEAWAIAGETVKLVPNSEEAHLVAGNILFELRLFEAALNSFRVAIQLNPESILAHESLGSLLTEMGELDEANQVLREVLKRPGDHARALASLCRIHQAALPDPDLAEIRSLLADASYPESLRAELHYAAAMVEDARGKFACAADNLRQGNEIRLSQNLRAGRAYRPDDHEQFVERMKTVCTDQYFQRTTGFGLHTTRPVFIFGLPRSGTSLTEQILASHSKVHGLGETDFARRGFESLPTVMDSKALDLDCLEQIDRETSEKLARKHLARLDAIDRLTPLLVDKMPDNYLYLGFLATIFPDARFIHCRRDLRDTAVSCWSTNFWYLDWPNSLEHIASRFEMYIHLMKHWQMVLPDRILHVDYEQTVSDLEATARKLLAWCDLAWEPSCLDFHQSKRVVRTASVTQVRQPIYRRSVQRWRNYEAELGPLFERLGSLIVN